MKDKKLLSVMNLALLIVVVCIELCINYMLMIVFENMSKEMAFALTATACFALGGLLSSIRSDLKNKW